MTVIDRRSLLLRGSLAGGAALLAPRLAFARAATDKRFVFVIQRGAADGLGIVMPAGDPDFAALRGAVGEAGGARLDGTFTLHPRLSSVARLYGERQALLAHALATPYRDRSHFDGQNVLETGGAGAYQLKDGWMNRMLGLMPAGGADAIAVSATLPVALRGRNEAGTYAPSAMPDASDDLLQRVTMLYRGDAQLHALWEDAMQTRRLTGDLAEGEGKSAAATGALAASLMRPADGARIVMIETGGWDTHTGTRQRLNLQLRGLDALIAALQAGLGPAWTDTMVLVATEFGRTVALNGTGGTDHGTGAAAMLLGGGVSGGRVLADWPGLKPAALLDGRDLRPTMRLEAFIAGAVAGHFALDPARTMTALFPQATGLRPVEGLARA